LNNIVGKTYTNDYDFLSGAFTRKTPPSFRRRHGLFATAGRGAAKKTHIAAPSGDLWSISSLPIALLPPPYLSNLPSSLLFPDINQLFASFLDAHLIYSMPTGYSLFSVRRPFRITSSLDSNGNQIFVAAATSHMTSGTYSALCGNAGLTCTSADTVIGQEVTHIDGVAIKSYVGAQYAKLGLYIDPGVQFNSFTSGFGFSYMPLSLMRLPDSDTYTVTLKSGTTYTFYNWGLYWIEDSNGDLEPALSTTAQLQALNIRSAKREQNLSSESKNAQLDSALLSKFERFFKDHPVSSLRRDAKNEADMDRLNMALDAMERVRARVVSTTSSSSSTSRNPVPLPILFQQRMEDSEILNTLIHSWNQDETPTVVRSATTAKSSSRIVKIHKNNKKDVVTSSQEVPLLTGNPNLFTARQSADGGAIQYLSYNGTTVVRLASFSATSRTSGGSISFVPMQNVLRTAVNNRNNAGLGSNLILDVSGNGGGYICLAQSFMAFLASNWESHQYPSSVASDTLFMPYDVRKSTYNNDLFEAGFMDPTTDERSPVNGAILGENFYNNGVQKTFGSVTGDYSQQFVWTDCSSSSWMDATQWFDKILIITDGTCGSACSLFTSGLRQSDKVRMMSYGGFWGDDLDTSSFAGGNVENWDDTVTRLGVSAPSWLKRDPTTADSTFNYREMFLKNGTTPRQFVRIPADYIVPNWDALDVSRFTTVSFLSSTQKQSLADLYSSALVALEDMPSNLLGVGSPSTPSTNDQTPTGNSSRLGPHSFVLSVLLALIAILAISSFN
jgi:hypothetical protein